MPAERGPAPTEKNGWHTYAAHRSIPNLGEFELALKLGLFENAGLKLIKNG